MQAHNICKIIFLLFYLSCNYCLLFLAVHSLKAETAAVDIDMRQDKKLQQSMGRASALSSRHPGPSACVTRAYYMIDIYRSLLAPRTD